MQIFKNSEDWEVIISSVQTEPPRSISRLRKMTESGLTVPLLEIAYLHGFLDLRKMTESGLTSTTFGNCISSWKLGDGICKST
jgi:hypothetical protein